MSTILDYATGLGASQEVLDWCRTTLTARLAKDPPPLTEQEEVIDYLISDAAPKRLRRMSWVQALAAAKRWSAASQKRGRNIVEVDGDTEMVLDLGNGTHIVKLLTKRAYEREGYCMKHCLAGYTPGKTTIYSLRDANNNPHVTFEVGTDGDSVQQVKGKGNGSIHPRYIEPTLAFLKHIGVEVRATEMANLGYYVVTPGMQAVNAMFVDSKGRQPTYSVFGDNTFIFGGVS
jgi:hypothetical protein